MTKHFGAAALSLFLLHCSGPRMVTEHLLLYVDPAAAQPKTSASAAPLPFTVAVQSLSLPPLYDNANVVMRTGNYTVRFAKRASWAVRPNLLAADLLTTCLRRSLPVKLVTGAKSAENPDFLVDGELRVIEEDLRGPERRASVALVLRVRREKRGEKLLLEKRYEGTRPCEDPSYAALAEQWSHILSEQINTFAADLAKALANEPVPASAPPAADAKSDE